MKEIFFLISKKTESFLISYGKYILFLSIMISFFIWPVIFPFKDLTVQIERGGTKFVLQRSNNSGNYYLKIDGLINNNYGTGSTFSSVLSTNNVKLEIMGDKISTGKVSTNEKINTGATTASMMVNLATGQGNSQGVRTRNGDYYFFQTENKLIFTPDLDFLDSEYLFDKPNYLSVMMNYFVPDNKIKLEFDCSNDNCKKMLNSFGEEAGLSKSDDKVYLKYQNAFNFKKEFLNNDRPRIVQNVNIPTGFYLEVDGKKYDFSKKEKINLDTCLVDVYYGKNRRETMLLKESPFLDYINIGDEQPKDNQLILKERNTGQKIYIYKDGIKNVRFVHPYNNYTINLDLDESNIEELEVNPFYEIILIRYKVCEQNICERSFSLVFN